MATKNISGFAFEKKNYFLLALGIAILIVGYMLMSGGGTDDPNVFSEAIFSPRRITLAPIVVMLGYIVIGYSIMWKPSAAKKEKVAEPTPVAEKSR